MKAHIGWLVAIVSFLAIFALPIPSYAQGTVQDPPFFKGVDFSVSTSGFLDNGLGGSLRFHTSSIIDLQEGGAVVSYLIRPHEEDTLVSIYGGGFGGSDAQRQLVGTPIGGFTAVYAPKYLQLRAWGHALGVRQTNGPLKPAANYQFSAAGTPLNTELFRIDIGLDVEGKNLHLVGSGFAAIELKRVQLDKVDLSARFQTKFTLACGGIPLVCTGALALPFQIAIEEHREKVLLLPAFTE